MIRQQWEKVSEKVDALSLRERVMIFAAGVFLLVSLVNTLLLDPVLLQQKKILNQIVQQDERSKEVLAQIEALMQAKNAFQKSPLRLKIAALKQELEEGNAYLKSNREHLVPPEKMADLLRQVLGRNSNLKLISLQTLAVTPLLEKKLELGAISDAATDEQDTQIFKHGVELTVRGNYLDLLNYLRALEGMSTQMFWGKAVLNVVKYPESDLSLTLYTLSLDKTWLQI